MPWSALLDGAETRVGFFQLSRVELAVHELALAVHEHQQTPFQRYTIAIIAELEEMRNEVLPSIALVAPLLSRTELTTSHTS